MLEEFREVHSFFWVYDEHLLDKVLGEGTDFFFKLDALVEGLTYLFQGEFVFVEEWAASEEHLVGDDSETPDIALLIVFLAIDYFWGHGEGRANPRSEVLIILE